MVVRIHQPEGTRQGFWYNSNSIKCYDNHGIALRLERAIKRPYGFKVYRAKKVAPPEALKSWQVPHKGVAGLARRVETSQVVNYRLSASLATVAEMQSLGESLEPLRQPVIQGGGSGSGRSTR